MTWDLESYGTLKQEKIKTMAKLVGMSQAPNGLSRHLDVSIIKKKKGEMFTISRCRV
jgi:hypothetical protein